jgi:tRNA threonylcarbamoyladenosine dehydratase
MENKITTMERGMQRRTELLLGKDNLEKIQKARVLIFGIGGVGSWCAEGLLRSGVRNITIVDSDRVCVTNCNRQLMATSRTLGEVKVEALRNRLLEINPDANITAYQKIYQARTELLLGKDNLEKIQKARVLIFGIGGVGSWCAEGLLRSGVRNITIVDSDRVCVTNCNRQLMATSRTLGEVKVEALRNRLLEINPDANITAYQKIYQAETADEFHMEQYDFIIDAIDSLKDKADLILRATALPKEITFISSMGAALRTDPFKVRKSEFWKVDGDPLARALRKKFKKNKTFPRRKFQCVYSEEKPMQNQGVNKACGTGGCLCPKAKLISGERGTDTAVYDAPGDQQLVEHEWCSTKAQINGSLCHITATFGMAIAGMVINHIIE